ncbi:MAG TPA: hypothetical protein VK809_02335, partial [Bacteroidia bacterium]|nr:hypothetical protein [Bacteroidia bacterium]
MTTIKSTQNISSKDNLILIGTAKSDFAKQGLTKTEADFAAKQIKAEEHIINVNQYSRRIFIYVAEDKKNENYTLEAFRRAGNKACGVFNAAKAESVTIVDLAGNTGQTLAFAEGMALGNYQFIQLKKDVKKLTHSLKTILLNSKNVTAKEIQNLQIVVDATQKA